jgi:antitoxin ParD1/3/4
MTSSGSINTSRGCASNRSVSGSAGCAIALPAFPCQPSWLRLLHVEPPKRLSLNPLYGRSAAHVGCGVIRKLHLAKICQGIYAAGMSTMNISLPESLKAFVDEQVRQRGYGTSSEYMRDLIRRDQDRMELRSLLLAGASSAPSAPVGPDYFEGLRERVRGAAKATGKASKRP